MAAKRKPLVFEQGEIIEQKGTDSLDLNQGVVKTSGTDTVERDLKDILGDVIDVRNYGAKGDGTTDDTAAFTKAAADASRKGGVVYVPHGTYKITETIPGEFVSFGHPTFTGDSAVTAAMDQKLTDLYKDYVHKTKNVPEAITGTKTFSASPIMPTPAATDNSTKGATTAFVKRGIDNLLGGDNVWTGTNTFNSTNPTVIKNLKVTEALDLSSMTPEQLAELLNRLIAGGASDGFEINNGKLKVKPSELISGTGTDGLGTDSNGKIKVVPSELAGNGLTGNDSTGKLNVDFSQTPPEVMKGILDGLLEKDGGLYWGDETGLLKVDFSKMDMGQFTDLLDKLELPYYVGSTVGNDTVPSTFYVDKSHANAKDAEAYFVTQNGKQVKKFYGWTADHPWKSIKYAANLLAKRYNINTTTVRVNVVCSSNGSPLEYTDEIILSQQTRSSGTIVFQPATVTDTLYINRTTSGSGNCITHNGGSWHFYDTFFKLILAPQVNASAKFPCIVASTSQTGTLSLHSCDYEFEDLSLPRDSQHGTYNLRAIDVNGGSINFLSNSRNPNKAKILVKDAELNGEQRFSYLNKGSVIAAGSWFNGRYVSQSITLGDTHYIKRKTVLATGSVIKGSMSGTGNAAVASGSYLKAGSIVDGVTLSSSTTYGENVEISTEATIVHVPLQEPETGSQFNYRSKFIGSINSCRIAAGSVLKAGSVLNGTTLNEDKNITTNTAGYAFTLANGSVLAAGSFLVKGTTLNNSVVQTSAFIRTNATVSSLTTFSGSDASTCYWLYIENGGILELTNSGENDNGEDYSNAMYYVEGRFTTFLHVIYNGLIRPRGTGKATYFLYDPDKVSGTPYTISAGGSMSISATDSVDRISYFPGDATPSVSYKTGAWVSPGDDN